MVQLLDADIRTKEVLGWKGLHLFHHQFSSCSEKVRIFLNLKGLDWESHIVDLRANEHFKPYFLGINPRGLVPVLVEDGSVYIESNDILDHLEQKYPKPPLLSNHVEHEAITLKHENALHLDIRTLTFRFMFDPSRPSKTHKDLQDLASNGAGTVRGARDADLERELTWHKSYIENGVSDEQARKSAQRLRESFEVIDASLATSEYILGGDLTMIDIAWLVYAQRLTDAGYPMQELHPHVAEWHARMMKQQAIAKEVALPEGMDKAVPAWQQELKKAGKTLTDICFPELRRPATD